MPRLPSSILRRLRRSGAFMVLLAACSGDAPADVTVTIDTVNGAERLTYSADPAASLGWTVDTVAIIGEALGSEAYQFADPGRDDLAGTPDGGVVVTDRQGGRVLEYGPRGEHRATYGRPGQGPGELRLPTGLALDGSDTLWVNDLSNRRLTGYPRVDGDGPENGAVRADGDPRVVPYVRGDVFPGSRIARWEGGFFQVVGVIGPPGQAIPEPLLRLDEELGPVDTLWLPRPEPIDIVELDLGAQEVVIGVAQEFWPRFEWRALSTGDVVVSDSADYVFRVLAGDGTVRRIVQRRPPARATTEADREAARARVIDELGFSVTVNGSGPEADAQRRMAEQRVEAMTFADRIPRIAALHVDAADRIWVGVSEDTAGVVQRIDIYEPDGTLLGELRGLPMPEAFAGTDRIVVTRKDELDVPQIVVLRLAETEGPP